MNKKYEFGKKIRNDIKNTIIDFFIITTVLDPIYFIYALLLRPPGKFFIY